MKHATINRTGAVILMLSAIGLIACNDPVSTPPPLALESAVSFVLVEQVTADGLSQGTFITSGPVIDQGATKTAIVRAGNAITGHTILESSSGKLELAFILNKVGDDAYRGHYSTTNGSGVYQQGRWKGAYSMEFANDEIYSKFSLMAYGLRTTWSSDLRRAE